MGCYLYNAMGEILQPNWKKSERTEREKKCYSSISMHARIFNGREQCAIDSNQKSVKCVRFFRVCERVRVCTIHIGVVSAALLKNTKK